MLIAGAARFLGKFISKELVKNSWQNIPFSWVDQINSIVIGDVDASKKWDYWLIRYDVVNYILARVN